MLQKISVGILFAFTLFSCEDDKPINKVVENDIKMHTKNQKIDSIVEMIQLQEYMKRENYGTWIYSEERIKHLKDSIHYDSIVLHRALKHQYK